MKNKLPVRLVTLLITASILLSCISVLSFAVGDVSPAPEAEAAAGTEVPGAGSNIIVPPEDGVILQLNRTFDEDFAYSEGFPSWETHDNEFEVVEDGDGNKYLRMTVRLGDGATSTTTGYVNFGFGAVSSVTDTIVFKLDVIFDSKSGLYPGNFIRFGDSTTGVLRPLALKSAGYNFFDGKLVSADYYTKTRHTLTYVIETEESDTGYLRTIKTYVDSTDEPVLTFTSSSTHPRVSSMRIGFFGTPPEGCVIGIDNILAYACDPDKISDPLSVDLGRSYGNEAEKVPFEEELVMKVGADSALSYGKKLVGITAPISIDGKAYVSAELVARHLGYTASKDAGTLTLTKSGAEAIRLTAGSYNVTVGSSTKSLGERALEADGEVMICYSDVERLFDGCFGSYNDMGVIVVSPVRHYALLASDMALVDVMKRFIFDSIDEHKEQVNTVDFERFTSSASSHPYLLADQEDFDHLKAIYDEGAANSSDPVLFSYVSTLVNNAATTYKNFSIETDGVCTAPTVLPVMPYDNNIGNGYDGTLGMQKNTDTYAERMKTLAFGYQITRDENYARLAYYYADALGKYEHWGPAHFLNCADTAGPYALCYDWLYNAWVEMGFDVDKITEALFTHAVLPGWYCVNNIPLPWGRRSNYKSSELMNSSRFQNMTNNWNAVCSAGVTAAALAIAGDLSAIDGTIEVKKATLVKNTGSNKTSYPYVFAYEYLPFTALGDHTGLASYADYAYDLYTTVQYTLPLNGLDFYAPDGSYVESPSYWAYSANSLFAIGAYNESVFGEDFGIVSNCWGIDKTCYFALNAQSSDYSMWNYSDSSSALVPGAVSTSSFAYAAYQLDDGRLAAIRKDMIASGRYSADYLDVFYYNNDAGELLLPELQYHMAGIDGYVARDSWEPGSTYVAIKGGYNESAHGQIDSGEFVYHNNGKIWFCDVGAEGYSVAGFGGVVSGNRYYKKNAEGNNTLALTSSPYSEGGTSSCFAGQYIYGTGYMYKTGDNEHGAFALIDQTEVYYKCAVSAKRGMLFTGDRSTVVIQDEVSFHEPETVYWIGHTYQDIYVTTGGRTAYMTDGESIIRVSLISSASDLRFDVISAYDFLLEDTHRPDYALNNGVGIPEDDRSAYKRLTVKCEDVTSLELAVVIEDVTGDVDKEVGYCLVPMDSWIPSEDARQIGYDVSVDFDENYYGYRKTGELEVYDSYFVDSNMLTVRANAYTEAGDLVAINFPAESFTSASLSSDVLVLDLDVFTDGGVGDLCLAVMGNGEVVARLPAEGLISRDGSWAHITAVATADTVRFYKDGEPISTTALSSVSFEDVKVAVVAKAGGGGSISLDNLRARRLDPDTNDVATLLGGASIAGWSGYIDRARERAEVFSYDLNGSRIYGYTFSELSSLDYEGLTVKFLYSNEHAPVTIDRACRIDHGNNAFRAESESLSAFIKDGVTEFKREAVTVYWHIGNTVETSECVGITRAEYLGTNSRVGSITESVVDGRSVFNATGWSTTEGGSLATEEEMLVTSENCHFYLVDDRVYYPYFCEDAAGWLIPRENTEEFMADVAAGYRRVILNGDIEVTAGGRSISKKVDLYLNGYTLTFNETEGEHMFNIKSGNLRIYGGGGAIVKTGSSKFFFTNKYKAYTGIDTIIYIENATLRHNTIFMDHRTGHVYFKNVVFEQEGDEPILVEQNRTNGQTAEAAIPKITLDGCTLNSPHASENTYSVSVAKNARLVVKGGTQFNIPVGIALRMNNTYTTGGKTEAYVDFTKMSLSVENAFFNASEIFIVEVVAPIVNGEDVSYTATTKVQGKKIYSGAYLETVSEQMQEYVLAMASKLRLGNMVRTPYKEIPKEIIAQDCRLARQNDLGAPYVCTSSYATVTWLAGERSVVEYWLNGSIPTADNEEAEANLELLNAELGEGKICTYPTGRATGRVTFEATSFKRFDISFSLLLHSSMDMRLYVEKCDGVRLYGIYLDGKKAEYQTVTLENGKTYYRITIYGVLPTEAAEIHELTVSIEDDYGNEAPVRSYFSVLDYIERILSGGEKYGTEACDLVANLLRYIDTSYRYAGLADTEDYRDVKALCEKYGNRFTYSEATGKAPEQPSAPSDAISSAEPVIEDVIKYRFYLREGYSGSVTLEYTVFGIERSITFRVMDGKNAGRRYIELQLDVGSFHSPITVSASGWVGTYSLGSFYDHYSTDGRLNALLNALASYSEKAEEYKIHT
ncbi:MAG: hypothetical protein IKC32_06995 [Clostridia bacterium]|nr:hypothetical protein [Clostridia bacterium]